MPQAALGTAFHHKTASAEILRCHARRHFLVSPSGFPLFFHQFFSILLPISSIKQTKRAGTAAPALLHFLRILPLLNRLEAVAPPR